MSHQNLAIKQLELKLDPKPILFAYWKLQLKSNNIFFV
jgi:hypothetical protein